MAYKPIKLNSMLLLGQYDVKIKIFFMREYYFTNINILFYSCNNRLLSKSMPWRNCFV